MNDSSLTWLPELINSVPRKSQREGYGKVLQRIGEDERVVVLDADLSTSTHTSMFGSKFPDRFFNMGISENNMMGTAAGLASTGMIPFVSSFAVFATGRAYDFVRQSICYSNQNVKIVATHAGLTVGEDGATHQMLEDIGLMCGLPNMVVLSPADAPETEAAVEFLYNFKGPAYMRLSREKLPVLHENNSFQFNKIEVLREGEDVTVAATGVMVYAALKAAEYLKGKGIDVSVLNVSTIKPIDSDTLVKFAKKTGLFITSEEHSIYNGLGSRVSEVLSENYPVPVFRHGMPDKFGESGTAWEVMDKYMLNPLGIVKTIEKGMEAKKHEVLFGHSEH